ncbi:hypothetical protein CY34DRAFT_37490, partial [Suillus luteus UH-Slu-Lm8-n1]
YKPVMKKVHSVPAATPPEYRIVRKLPPDPLVGITPLPTHPPDFSPGIRFMQTRADKLDIDPAKWLWPEEAKLVLWLIRTHELVFAWEASEHGRLDERYFPPYKIPTVPHAPWSQCNIPVLP